MARLLQLIQPFPAGRAHLFERGQDIGGIGAVAQLPVDFEFDRQTRQFLQFLVGAEHEDVDPRHHAGDGLVGDLRERFLAKLEKHEIGAIAQHEELEVVVPHLRERLDATVIGYTDIMVLPDAATRGHHLDVVEFGQRRNLDVLDLLDEGEHAPFPLVIETVPVLIVEPGPLLKQREPSADFGGIPDRVGGDVDAAVDDAMIDAEGRRKREDAGREGAQSLIGNFRGHDVERRHRLREMHRVVEPEDLVVLRPETREVGVHGLPAFGSRDVADFRGQRESAAVG